MVSQILEYLLILRVFLAGSYNPLYQFLGFGEYVLGSAKNPDIGFCNILCTFKTKFRDTAAPLLINRLLKGHPTMDPPILCITRAYNY